MQCHQACVCPLDLDRLLAFDNFCWSHMSNLIVVKWPVDCL